MAEFRMPSLGADMDAGTLTRWNIRPGDRVRRGDIVATVETDKADVDVEVWVSGTVAELLVREGERVPVGTPLAAIEEDGAPARPLAGLPRATAEATPGAPPAAAPPPEPPPTTAPSPPTVITAPAPSAVREPREPSARPRVSPLARATAERLGLDLGAVLGTGIGGAITREDVERAAAAGAPAPAAVPPPAPPPPPTPAPRAPPAARVPGARAPERAAAIRRAIAAAMSRSHREIPHYYLARTVDLQHTLQWLERTNRQRPVRERLIPSALFVKAVATAALEVPEMNGHWVEDAFRPAERVNVGFGIHIPDAGLIAPALIEVERHSLSEVMRALRDLVARARAGALRSSEMSEATITVTNLGERGGVDAVFGIINPPQVALVGFGAIQERAWAEGGMLAARRQVTVSLAADHRASDGHRGALYLAAVARLLQEPEQL